MSFKVVPFNAGIVKGEGAANAATQLESLINEQENEGWHFQGLETIQTVITTAAVPPVAGSAGCLGIGARPGVPRIPERRDSTQVYVAVFEKAGQE